MRILPALALASIVLVPAIAGAAPQPIGVLYPGTASLEPAPAPALPPELCTEDCFLLSSLVLRGSASAGMTFELHGSVRAKQELKIPLFGPPSQVRVDDVTIDGVSAPISFDTEHYVVFTARPSFVIRGKIALGTDQLLSVPGPIVSVDAKLASGRLVEGERISGVSHAVLHFDPMLDGEIAKPKVTPVFRLARAVRFGRETTFEYRLNASQGDDLGTIRLPLRHGEKVVDVTGSTGWSESGGELALPTSGPSAEIVITGTLPAEASSVKTFTPDSRSAYEWWLVEADVEHQIETAGDGKLVQTTQSPIQPQFSSPRVFLLQKGQSLEVEAQSLVRGDVLAAVARTSNRYVAITGSGDLISDEKISYENNGLEHLLLSPAGRAMYLSVDRSALRILHPKAGASAVLVPLPVGLHMLRVQSLADTHPWPLVGAITIPPTTYPIATSAAETTIGLPEDIHPLAVLGGDHVRWLLGRGDLAAALVGIALACFGFRTRRTRALASVVTVGLWFVSRDAFVVATSALFLTGAVFLASRFVRGSQLLLAAGALTVVALLGGRSVLGSTATDEPHREMTVQNPEPLDVEHDSNPGGKDIAPVSLSFPTSEHYVRASRQLVSQERPFVPRILYVTSTLLALLYAAWLALVGLLVWAHRTQLAVVKARVLDRIRRRPSPTPDPATATEAPPF